MSRENLSDTNSFPQLRQHLKPHTRTSQDPTKVNVLDLSGQPFKEEVQPGPGTGNTMADKERYINERLIAEVSRYEVLYNTKCPNYKIGSERDPAWAQVAASMASTPEECKQRWRVLRDAFVRHHKKMKEGGPKEWRFSQQMAFVAPFIRKRKDFGESPDDGGSVDGVEYEGVSQDSEYYQRLHTDAHGTMQGPFVLEATPPVGLRGDYDRLLNCLQAMAPVVAQSQPRDEAELYLLSLAPAYRRLSAQNKARARIQIETIMSDLEFGSGSESQADVTMDPTT